MSTVQQLVDGDRIFLATQKCARNVEDLEWDVDDIVRLIATLQAQDYRNSEWCAGRGGAVIEADAYAVHYDHIEAFRSDQRHPQYYLKFGFRPDDPCLIVWVMSCHLSS